MDKSANNQYEKPDLETEKEIVDLMGPTIDQASVSDVKIEGRKDQPELAQSEDSISEESSSVPIAELDIKYNEQKDDAAVEDIVLQESNELIESQDSKNQEIANLSLVKKGGLKKVFSWFLNRKRRNLLLALLFLVLIVVFAVPHSRYFVLNSFGARASVSFVVEDKVSGLPIRNVEASIGEISTKSNDKGEVTVSGVRLGKSELVLKKRSFKEEKVQIVVGWGSNPFASSLELTPTGTVFPFNVKDWLSGVAIEGVEVTDGESTAITDAEGLAELKIEPTDDDLEIIINKKGYRQESVTIKSNDTESKSVSMVASDRDVFVSKRNGKYDIYSRYVDGKSEDMLLQATGSEQSDTAVVPGPENIVAVVSSREGNRNDDGFILSNLYIMSVVDKSLNRVGGSEAENLRIIGWSKNKLIFIKTVSGPSAYSQRQKIVAYDIESKQSKELAVTDYFSDVRLFGDDVYYTVSAKSGSESLGLSTITVNGTDKKVLIAKSVWYMTRNSFSTLTLSVEGNEWYSYNIFDKKVSKIEGAPANNRDSRYIEGGDRRVAWVETRDGKTVLFSALADIGTLKESRELVRKNGIQYPLRWLNDTTLLYMVKDMQESASYVISVSGGEPVRVGDLHLNLDQNSFYNQ